MDTTEILSMTLDATTTARMILIGYVLLQQIGAQLATTRELLERELEREKRWPPKSTDPLSHIG
jgi:hypothetical protein